MFIKNLLHCPYSYCASQRHFTSYHTCMGSGTQEGGGYSGRDPTDVRWPSEREQYRLWCAAWRKERWKAGKSARGFQFRSLGWRAYPKGAGALGMRRL